MFLLKKVDMKRVLQTMRLFIKAITRVNFPAKLVTMLMLE